MALPTLNAHYSIPDTAARFLLTLGFASVCYYISRLPGFDPIALPLLGFPFLCASVVYLRNLLTAKTRVVMSIDVVGFKDTRLSRTVIPWSAIKSMGPYVDSRYKKEIGVNVEIAPEFWHTLSRRLNFRFWKYVGMGLESETSANLETRSLDTDWSEILQVAGSYTLIRTHDWSSDFT
jgi:hypothetical protein